MKSSVLLIASILLAGRAFGHGLSDEVLLERSAKFQRMKTTGITLAIVGGAQALVGATLMFLAEDEDVVDDNGYVTATRTDPKTPIGAINLALGVPVSVVGIVLGSIGHSRSIMYRDLFDEARMGIKYDRQSMEVVLKVGF